MDFNGNDMTAQFDPQDIKDNKVVSLLSYLWILFFIPLVAAPKSQFGRFHANQGLVLFLADIIAGVVLSVLGTILRFIPVVGYIISTILSAVFGILMLVLIIIGIVNAANGKAKELPLIGKIRIIK